MIVAAKKNVQVTLVRSLNGCTEKTKASVRGLGLRRLHHSRIVALTPENAGMINKIVHLLKVIEIS